MTRMESCYGEIVDALTRYMGQRAYSYIKMGILKRSAKESKRVSVESFDEHDDSGLCTQKCFLLHLVMEDIQIFETISVLNSSPYGQFNTHIKHSHKKTL